MSDSEDARNEKMLGTYLRGNGYSIGNGNANAIVMTMAVTMITAMVRAMVKSIATTY